MHHPGMFDGVFIAMFVLCFIIYSRIQHPMYTALFVIAAAQLLLIGNAVVAPAFLLAFSVLYFARIDHEEAMMLERFGGAYADYQSRTNRLLPSLRR
jgi:protein-S-isoprenylcysteine O-methyltransferase Ste14